MTRRKAPISLDLTRVWIGNDGKPQLRSRVRWFVRLVDQRLPVEMPILTLATGQIMDAIHKEAARDDHSHPAHGL